MVHIKGKGSILFQRNNGEQRLLQYVYYILRLCTNIIKLGQLSTKSDKIMILGLFLLIHDKDGKILMKLKQSPNRLYEITLDT